jgi:hypothetical protein
MRIDTLVLEDAKALLDELKEAYLGEPLRAALGQQQTFLTAKNFIRFRACFGHHLARNLKLPQSPCIKPLNPDYLSDRLIVSATGLSLISSNAA